MEHHAAARKAQAQGAGGVHSLSWNNRRSVGRAGGRLKPEFKVTIERNRPPALGGDAVTFIDMREFRVAYTEYEQQTYHKQRWKGPGSREGARAGRFGDPKDGGW